MSEQVQERVVIDTPFEYRGEVTISTNVSNLDRSIEWYGKAFGFELIYKLDEYGWCELATPIKGVSIGLSVSDEPKGGMSPHFTVADIEAARKHLEKVGAQFDGETTTIEGMVKLASFKDPDGNSFGLAQPLSQ